MAGIGCRGFAAVVHAASQSHFRRILLLMAFSTNRLPLSVVNIGTSRCAHNIFIVVGERYG